MINVKIYVTGEYWYSSLIKDAPVKQKYKIEPLFSMILSPLRKIRLPPFSTGTTQPLHISFKLPLKSVRQYTEPRKIPRAFTTEFSYRNRIK